MMLVNLVPITVIGSAKISTPDSIVKEAISFPNGVMGNTSP